MCRPTRELVSAIQSTARARTDLIEAFLISVGFSHEDLNICSVQLKTQPWLLHMNPFTHKTTKPMAILNSCSRIPLLQLRHCLKSVRAVISAVLSLDEHLSQTNTSCVPKCCYQSVYCCLIRYFFVRMRIAKCFTNSSKRFRCEVMFDNEHTFCSWIHHVRICTAFAQLVWAAAQRQGWPWLECHGRGWESLLYRGGPASDFSSVP
jgi:hypothetical protein